jgi:hypothetical protein
MVYIRYALLAGGGGTKAEPLAPFLPIAIVVRQKQESRHSVPDELACQLMEALAQVAATAIALSQGSYKARWMRPMVNHQSPDDHQSPDELAAAPP